MQRTHAFRLALLTLCAVSSSLILPAAHAGYSCSSSCLAPTVTGQVNEGDRDATQAFAGVNWAFGRGPELVLGVRQTRTNDRHRVVGAKVEATFPFTQSSISYDKLRMRLIAGHRNAMTELGGGYSFLGKDFLLSGAVQGNYVVLGTDFTLDSFKWQPFVGINTLGRLEAPGVSSDGTLSCPANYYLVPAGSGAGAGATSGQIVNGQTCSLGIA